MPAEFPSHAEVEREAHNALDFCGSAREGAKQLYWDAGLDPESDPEFDAKVLNAVVSYSRSLSFRR